MLHNLGSDLWEGFISRTSGPLKFRFFLQPAMAIFLAVRGGLQDWRAGRPAFFWEFCTDPAKRRELMREGWKSVGKLFILACMLDIIYQLIVLRWIYPIDALLIAFFLAIIPYLLVRGPVNRIAPRADRPSAQRPSPAGRPHE